jgi:hypothetical protein
MISVGDTGFEPEIQPLRIIRVDQHFGLPTCGFVVLPSNR